MPSGPQTTPPVAAVRWKAPPCRQSATDGDHTSQLPGSKIYIHVRLISSVLGMSAKPTPEKIKRAPCVHDRLHTHTCTEAKSMAMPYRLWSTRNLNVARGVRSAGATVDVWVSERAAYCQAKEQATGDPHCKKL